MAKFQPSLKDQVALITGANSGIGAQVTRDMAQAGASVGVNYITDKDKTDKIVNQIWKDGGKAIALEADVSQEDQVNSMFDRLIDEFGTLDILVNNAGIQKDNSFEEMTLQNWQKVLEVNLTGAFLCSRRAVKEFLRQGIDKDRSVSAGKIIFMSSVHEEIPWAGHANYTASKGAIRMLMKTIAQEFGSRRIRANSIAPGAIKTPINTKAWQDPEAAEKLRQLIPYDRIGETEDIAPVVTWLSSDAADYITGTTLFVDGGMMLYPGFREGG